jgi:hypothetical protein
MRELLPLGRVLRLAGDDASDRNILQWVPFYDGFIRHAAHSTIVTFLQVAQNEEFEGGRSMDRGCLRLVLPLP